ncbi:MAG: hypothetical protein ACFCVA_11655 [Gammaproteobacteria bacterium]
MKYRRLPAVVEDGETVANELPGAEYPVMSRSHAQQYTARIIRLAL